MAFERLLVSNRLAPNGSHVDFGRLAEEMLFYQTVTIRVTRAGIEELIRAIGALNLIELMQREALRVEYVNNVVATRTRKDGIIELHSPILVTAEHLELARVAYDLFPAARLADEFLKHAADVPHEVSILREGEAFVQELEDVRTAVLDWISHAAPLARLNAESTFVPTWHPDGAAFTVATNISFDELSQLSSGPFSPASAGTIIGGIATAYATLARAARLRAEVATNSTHAVLIGHLARHMLARHSAQSDQPPLFQNVIFKSGHAIAEAVNSGLRDSNDVLDLLDDAAKFLSWLSKLPVTTNLVEEYYQAALSGSWAAKLPIKSFRWIVTALTSVAMPGVDGLLIDAADNFLVESIARGWRPNQFVDGPLRSFIFGDPNS
jgi:hypothetical protein